MKRVICFAFILLLFSGVVFAAAAKSEVWTSIQSKNFEIAGNADEAQIRAAARRIEQFREVFHQIFPNLKLESTVPTRVIIFKDALSYTPFKPLRTDGSADSQVVGAFQAGAEVNYITLSMASHSPDGFDTIFHEYTHFLISNNLERSKIEPWFNEGLAEYFETFKMESEQKAILGSVPPANLKLLQQEQLIPLERFFNTDNYSLNNQSDYERSLFYAQAWALMHYLQQGAKRERTSKFFDLIFKGKSSSDAFQTAFDTDLILLEKELKNYIKQPTFQNTALTISQKPVINSDFKTTLLTEAQTETMLGDLLLHSNRMENAAAHLEKALALDETSATAHALYGVVLMHLRKFTEAEAHLVKAVRFGERDYLAHYYYAFVLSREDIEPYGFVESYRTVKANKMRELLKKTIEIKSDFAEAYHLLAFINLVNEENLDEAVELMEKALDLQPGNQYFLLDLAQIRMRQTEYKTAEHIAEKIFLSAADKDLRLNAQAVLISARQIQETLRKIEAEKKLGIKNNTEYPQMSKEEGYMLALNEALRKPQNGEQRVLGYLKQIDCGTNGDTFVLRPKNSGQDQFFDETLKFSAVEMQKVRMIAFVAGIEGKQMGCGVRKPEIFAVVTFRPANGVKTKSNGEIVSLEFVPSDFRFLP